MNPIKSHIKKVDEQAEVPFGGGDDSCTGGPAVGGDCLLFRDGGGSATGEGRGGEAKALEASAVGS